MRNDLVITRYRLGQFDDCLASLSGSLAIEEKYKDDLDALPPTDAEEYDPAKEAAQHNQMLCTQGRQAEPAAK